MLICLDIETTGLNPNRDKIIEVGAALVDLKTRKIKKRYETFISPGVPVPHAVTHLTGITDKDLEGAPRIEDIKDKLLKFVGDYPIMGHNINFDLDFLDMNDIETSNTRLDSMDIAHMAIPKEHSYSLEILAEIFGAIEVGKHRALHDAEVNIDLMFKLFDFYFSNNEEKIPEIIEVLKKSESPWKDHLLEASKAYKKFSLPEKKEQSEEKGDPITQNAEKSLIEKPEYNLADLIPEEGKTIIALPAIPENTKLETVLEANQYLDPKLFKKLTKKKSISSEETIFALKILPLIKDKTLSRLEITLPMELKNHWFENAYKSLPKEVEEGFKSDTTKLISHGSLARLCLRHPALLENSHLIIDQVDEFLDNAQRSLTSIFTENRFQYGPLSKEIKERLSMLFGYLGIMYEKYGSAYELEMTNYHFSVIDWQRAEDLIEKLAEALENEPESEDKQLLLWLYKARKFSPQIKVSIGMMQDEQPILKTTPLNTSEIFTAKIWPIPEKLTLISPAVTYEKEETPGTFIKNILSLPSDIEVEILTKKSPKITLKEAHSTPKSPEYMEKAVQEFKKTLPKKEGLTYILTSSQGEALKLHQKLALPLKKEHQMRVMAQNASGGRGKIKRLCQNREIKTVLIGTYDFFRTVKPEIDTLIIYKVPFPPPSTIPFAHGPNTNTFLDYAYPTAMLKIKKIATHAGKVISFDNRINI